MTDDAKNTRHILSLSGGKDSAALAVYMKGKIPGMEYVFCDTGKELPETYDYLAKLEAYLGQPIVRLNSERDFDHWLKIFGNFLPSSRMRWCTRQLKIKPYEKYIGDDPVISYIGIRADEDREGYISTKPNIVPKYPFKEDGLVKEDIFRILEESGLSIPEYYKWRTRSGCYFCFFQRKSEWMGLAREHPELFEQAAAYEKQDGENGVGFTWQSGESLTALRTRLSNHSPNTRSSSPKTSLLTVLQDDEDDEDEGCAICTI